MEIKYYNVSSVRLMRFLYALGFSKESYLNKNRKKNWRYIIKNNIIEALDFYHRMRKRNK